MMKQQTIRTTLRKGGFSTKTAKAGKKRRRPKSRLDRLDKRGLTVREQQIMLSETNLRVRKTYMDKGEDLMNVARGRLGWMRHQLYSYWNPDYDKESVLDSDRTNPTRKFGAGPVMDTRWWFWNIVFALSPAIFIALYCEFRGKPRQLEFHRQQQIVQMRAAMGDEWCEKNAEKILKKYAPPEDTIWDKVVQSLSELASVAYLWVKGEEDFHVEATPSLPSLAAKETKEIPPIGNSSKIPVLDVSPETKIEDEKPTVEALLRRVQQLEQQQQLVTSSSTVDQSQSKDDVSFEDFQLKSGIRKRMDASLVKQWEEKLAETTELEDEQRTASSTYIEQLDHILNWTGLKGLLNGTNLSQEPQEALETAPEPAPSKTEENEDKPPTSHNSARSSPRSSENVDDVEEVVGKRRWWSIFRWKADVE